MKALIQPRKRSTVGFQKVAQLTVTKMNVRHEFSHTLLGITCVDNNKNLMVIFLIQYIARYVTYIFLMEGFYSIRTFIYKKLKF